MSQITRVSTCVLNQWALDFCGNKNRIIESIIKAKKNGASYRLGPELEVSGYGCSDHFLEGDTYVHSWEVLCDIIRSSACRDIVCDIGLPVRHKNVAYNCRVILLNGRILLIRPKMHLADDGNFREGRWFSSWSKRFQVEDHILPDFVSQAIAEASDGIAQTVAPFGDALLQFHDTCVGIETCEELWNIDSSHIAQSLDGAEVFVNSSASHHELRKLNARFDLIRTATRKAGGVYMYSNLRGCDGDRVYYDGGALIVVNGQVVAQSNQFGLTDVEVITASVDLDEIRTYRQSCQSFCHHATNAKVFPRIFVDWRLCAPALGLLKEVSQPRSVQFFSPEEEIALGPACWLWDYLRRSGQAGFLLPLSGGIDSSASACIVHNMCRLVVEAVAEGDTAVLADCRKIVGETHYFPTDAKELCSRLLTTVYMGTANSSSATRHRAAELAEQLGSYHLCAVLDTVVAAMLAVMMSCLQLSSAQRPRFRAHGGSAVENAALQNLQARLRMVLAYLLAQLSMWARRSSLGAGLLVLGSANLDEGLRGYLTKYDCSSADINPIGGLSKTDLRSFVHFCAQRWGSSALSDIEDAPATAELEPLTDDGQVVQTDEQDMGMTYADLAVFGKLRTIARCGLVSMFRRLAPIWARERGFAPRVTAERVRFFFRCYAINRHKMTVITPAYHAEKYGTDDNRYDLRHFLYETSWRWQWAVVERDLDAFDAEALFNPIIKSDGVTDALPLERRLHSDATDALPLERHIHSNATDALSLERRLHSNATDAFLDMQTGSKSNVGLQKPKRRRPQSARLVSTNLTPLVLTCRAQKCLTERAPPVKSISDESLKLKSPETLVSKSRNHLVRRPQSIFKEAIQIHS